MPCKILGILHLIIHPKVGKQDVLAETATFRHRVSIDGRHMGQVECRRGVELPAAPCGGIYGRRPLHRDTKLPCLAALQPGELRMSRRSWGRNRCRPPSCLSMPVRSCLCACCQEVDARRQNCLLLWHACRLEHGSMWSAEISGYFSCQGMFGRTHSFWVQMITCYVVCKIAGLLVQYRSNGQLSPK